jgi:hypothetical protein
MLRRSTVQIVRLSVVAAVVIIVLLLFLTWYIAPETPGQRKDLVLTLAQILGGMVLLSGLYFTWRTLQVNQEGQITERFTRAIDQLGDTDDNGNPRLEIRIGGIYALERIAIDSPERDYSTVMEVLTAYVRGNARRSFGKSKEADEHGTSSEGAEQAIPYFLKEPRADIRAIVDIIRHREKDPVEKNRVLKKYRVRFDLRRTNLERADLEGVYLGAANLKGAYLKGAYLKGADLYRVNLQKADLRGACFEQAWLEEAILVDADLRPLDLQEVDLRGAYLKGADLRGADLRGADLRGAKGLTKEQLEAQAKTLEGATMPDGSTHD